MSYNTFYKEINDGVEERYNLVIERVSKIINEETVKEPFRSYFVQYADYILLLDKILKLTLKDEYRKLSLEELADINYKLYNDLVNEYDKSSLNPTYCYETLGQSYGKYLMWLGQSIRNLVESAVSAKAEKMVIYIETFVEIYNLFETDDLSEKNLKDIIYWFNHDYSEILSDYSIKEMLDTNYSFATSIVLDSNLDDLSYLYYYGEYISQNELETAKLLNEFTDEKIESIAKTFVNGFINGFKIAGKDLSKKETVEIRYNIGFEKVVKSAIEQFGRIGLKPIIRRLSYESTCVNKQYDYDHRYDDAPVFDKCIKDRRIEVAKVVFEKYKDLAAKMSGPAVIETFGEKPFSPVDKKEAVKYDEKQQKLRTDFKREYMQIVHQYIKQDERSFTIISYPVAEIGENYKEIFEDTIKINNLDGEIYKEIQTKIIDALDKGDYVEISGMNGNKTNLIIKLGELSNPKNETLFENCLADVNIPLGEVFTSPKLKGTTGKLHVTKVYLYGLNYIDLELDFEDGMVSNYNCKNFENEKSNKDYIKENLLQSHDTLPIGEFAIGTNTTAYVIGKKHDIIHLMPILIVEKMGPHFAIGDTCYSYEEDEITYNPNGKKIMGKSNEISDLRNEDISKAYFNCHTDITIPYDELGSINVVTKDGNKIALLENGRFVLEGTEKLNEPFNKISISH